MTIKPNECIKCKWCKNSNDPNVGIVCTRMEDALESWGVDSSDYINKNMTCQKMRRFGKIRSFLFRQCGKDGNLFEPKGA